MKKIFWGGVALISMLLSWSCSHELDGPNGDGAEVAVNFAIEVEGALATRAISDGTGANQLSWAIFSETGELIHSKTVKDNVTGLLTESGHSIAVSLAKGKTYKAVFWAQNPECTAYTVSDDMKVTVNYEGLNNDEARDAFFASSDPFTVTGSTSVAVVLKRPFAQVNVGAYAWDLQYAQESGNDVKMSGATIKNVANCINLFDGSVEGDVELSYSLAAVPEEDLMVDVDENGVKEVYEYLSMSYVLASPEGTTHEMAFTFADAEGNGAFDFTKGLGAVTIQRNWRTNIVGQILTGDISFNIKIDPTYEGETLNSGGLYYNFTDDTLIEDKLFAFNTPEAATFTTENNNLLTVNNVEFAGKVQFIAFGEYRDKGNYVSFTNNLTNVTAKDMVVTHSVGIANVETIDYMAPLIFLRGVTTLENCEFTGTTSLAPDKKDYNGKMHPVLPYDCGVPNGCEAIFNNCKVDRLYAWSHSKITLNNSQVKYIRCSTHRNSEPDAHLTIGSGTVVDEIVVTSTGLAKFVKIDGVKTLVAEFWTPSLIIKAGATVKKLDMNGRTMEHVKIEEGANVGEIVNQAE